MRLTVIGIAVGICLGLMAGSGLTAAQAAELFPQSRISVAQWQILFNQIRSRPGRHVVNRPDLPHVLVVEVPSDGSVYYFAKGGPAYPAVLVAHVVRQDAHVYLEKRGYFAGIESEFARWFDAVTIKTEDFSDLVRNLPAG